MVEVPPRSDGESAMITIQECIAVRDAALNCLAGFEKVRLATDIIPKEYDIHRLHELEAAILDARTQWDDAWTPIACDWFHEHVPNPARRFGNQISASLWASQLLVAAEHDLRMAMNGLLPQCGMIPKMGGSGATEADIQEEYLAAKRAIVEREAGDGFSRPRSPKEWRALFGDKSESWWTSFTKKHSFDVIKVDNNSRQVQIRLAVLLMSQVNIPELEP